MNPSLFNNLFGWFSALALRLVERWNGRTTEPEYLYQQMLTPEESLDLTWSSVDVDNNIVMADVVDLDSPLPLKDRPSYEAATGRIPKLGMKKQKSETLLTQVRTMIAHGRAPAEVANRLYVNDLVACRQGVHERLEDIFLTEISTGVGLVPDEENVGTAIRIAFNIPADNRRGVAVPWGTTGYTPITDLANAISYANDNNGDVITVAASDLATFNQLRTSDEARYIFASSNGASANENSPAPTRTAFTELLMSEYGIRYIVVNRNTRYQKNSVTTTKQPFAANTVVLLTSEQVGRLVWSRLAEMDYPVNGVEYATVDNFILLSEYSKNDPLAEFTSSQAIAVPVLDNVNSIYYINTQQVQG